MTRLSINSLDSDELVTSPGVHAIPNPRVIPGAESCSPESLPTEKSENELNGRQWKSSLTLRSALVSKQIG